MTGTETMLTICEDDAIRNHPDSGSTDIVNIQKEEVNAIFWSLFFIFTLKIYAFVTYSLIWK